PARAGPRPSPPVGRPSPAAPVSTVRRAWESTGTRWSRRYRAPMIRRTAATGATTDTNHCAVAAQSKTRLAWHREATMANALSDKERALIDAYWRAANYLSVGQIYLYDNPLLKQSLTKEHIKPRLLGHWGTTPGLNFVYVHLNRVIVRDDLDAIYVTGPGHGGPRLGGHGYP